jgi:predicted nucleotidyltransferase
MSKTLSKVEQLENKLGVRWNNLRVARQLTSAKQAELREALKTYDSEDTSIVVSGSLARAEFSGGSDVDWSLLIDGSADPSHYRVQIEIKRVIDEITTKSVGAEGTFGAMVFSHDLIHEIGGEDDTNRNTTRRLLLLLESVAVGREEAYRRVVRNILNRYLLEDRGFWVGSEFRVPRFLQNDFARYWRTMAVDFAYKLRSRSGTGWAIRNVKLRMSRKLIYVSGLLGCFLCHLDHTADEWEAFKDNPSERLTVIEYLEYVFRQTPLEIASGVLLRFDHLNGAAMQIFGAYDRFLGILADDDQRKHLEELTEEAATNDGIYQETRELSHAFRDGLLTFFFDEESGMERLTQNYGVF